MGRRDVGEELEERRSPRARPARGVADLSIHIPTPVKGIKDALAGSSSGTDTDGKRMLGSYRRTVSSLPFRMDGPVLVDEGVSCSGSAEVYPEVQRRRAGALAARILLAEHGNSYFRCSSAAMIPPKPQ